MFQAANHNGLVATIRLETKIHADIEMVFDLARSIEAHLDSTSKTGEHVIAGRSSGFCELGDQITWRARHFGVWQNLTVEITSMKRPSYFIDDMVKGAFKSMQHTHTFKMEDGVTTMADEFTFEAPLGFLGRLAEKLFLTRYMRGFLVERNENLKTAAETAALLRP